MTFSMSRGKTHIKNITGVAGTPMGKIVIRSARSGSKTTFLARTARATANYARHVRQRRRALRVMFRSIQTRRKKQPRVVHAPFMGTLILTGDKERGIAELHIDTRNGCAQRRVTLLKRRGHFFYTSMGTLIRIYDWWLEDMWHV